VKSRSGHHNDHVTLLVTINYTIGLTAQGLTFQQTHYRSYRGRVLHVKWPNQQCQSSKER